MTDMNRSFIDTEPNLVGYFQLNEGTGNQVLDRATNDTYTATNPNWEDKKVEDFEHRMRKNFKVNGKPIKELEPTKHK